MGAALLALVAAQGATAYRAAALAPAGAPRPPAARSAAPRLRAARVGARPPRPPPLSMHGAHHGEGAHAHGDEGVELSRGVLAQSLRHLLTHRWWAASARAPASGGGALALDATAGGLGWRGALARWRAYLPHDEDRITLVGAAINIFLSALKLAAGVLGHSAAMVADAAHSLSDLASDVITMWSVRMGRLPPDDDHPYGHGRFEALGSLLIAAMLVGTGWAIGAHAWQHGAALLAGQAALAAAAAGGGHVHGVVAIAPRPIALVAALLSLFSKEWLYRATAAVGRRLGSTVVVANAQHHRSDALSSVVAFFGIGGAMLGLPLLDPLAGARAGAPRGRGRGGACRKGASERGGESEGMREGGKEGGRARAKEREARRRARVACTRADAASGCAPPPPLALSRQPSPSASGELSECIAPPRLDAHRLASPSPSLSPHPPCAQAWWSPRWSRTRVWRSRPTRCCSSPTRWTSAWSQPSTPSRGRWTASSA